MSSPKKNKQEDHAASADAMPPRPPSSGLARVPVGMLANVEGKASANCTEVKGGKHDAADVSLVPFTKQDLFPDTAERLHQSWDSQTVRDFWRIASLAYDYNTEYNDEMGSLEVWDEFKRLTNPDLRMIARDYKKDESRVFEMAFRGVEKSPESWYDLSMKNDLVDIHSCLLPHTQNGSSKHPKIHREFQNNYFGLHEVAFNPGGLPIKMATQAVKLIQTGQPDNAFIVRDDGTVIVNPESKQLQVCNLKGFEGFAICSINGKRVDGVEQFQDAWEKATVVKDDPEIKKRQRKQSKEATYQEGTTLALEARGHQHNAGFFESVQKWICEKMRLAPEDPIHRIDISGHSFGGAYATLAAIHIRKIFPGLQLRIVTWGSPKVGDDAFVKYYQNLGLADVSIRLTCGADPVPCLPLHSFEKGFQKFVQKYAEKRGRDLPNTCDDYVHICDEISLQNKWDGLASIGTNEGKQFHAFLCHEMEYYYAMSRRHFQSDFSEWGDAAWSKLKKALFKKGKEFICKNAPKAADKLFTGGFFSELLQLEEGDGSDESAQQLRQFMGKVQVQNAHIRQGIRAANTNLIRLNEEVGTIKDGITFLESKGASFENAIKILETQLHTKQAELQAEQKKSREIEQQMTTQSQQHHVELLESMKTSTWLMKKVEHLQEREKALQANLDAARLQVQDLENQMETHVVDSPQRTSLESTLEIYKQQVGTLGGFLQANKQQLQLTEERLDNERKHTQNLEDQMRVMREEREALLQEQLQIREDLSQKIDDLQAKENQMCADLTAAEDLVRDLQVQLKERGSDDPQRAELKDSLAKANERVRVLEADLKDERGNMSWLQAQINSSDREIHKLNCDVDDLQLEKKDLANILEQQSKNVANLEQKYEEEMQSKATLEGQLASLETKDARLQKDLEAERRRSAKLEEQACKMQLDAQRKQSLERSLAAARKKVSTIERELELERQKKAGVEEQLLNRQKSVESLTRQLEDERARLQAKIKAQERFGQQLAKDVKDLREKEQLLQEDLKVERLQVDRIRADFEGLREDSQHQKSELEGALQSATARVEQIQNNLRSEREKRLQLENELEPADKLATSLQAKLETEQEARRAAEKMVRIWEEKAGRLQTEVKACQARINDLEMKLDLQEAKVVADQAEEEADRLKKEELKREEEQHRVNENADQMRKEEIKRNEEKEETDDQHVKLLEWIKANKIPAYRFAPRYPKTKADLLALTTINASRCNIKGPIPESLGNCIQLKVLVLRENQLSGKIPESLGNCTELTELKLYMNKLEGELPLAIIKMIANGVDVNLHGNTGFTLPLSIGDLGDITNLDLSDCSLTGKIPESLGNCTKLTDLRLHWNQLEGQIPESLGNCIRLERLNLSYNQLSDAKESKAKLKEQLPKCTIYV